MAERRNIPFDSQKIQNVPTGPDLRDIRVKKGITLTLIAKELEHTKGYISSIETGKKPLPENLRHRWLDILGISARERFALNQDLAAETVNYWAIPYERTNLFVGRKEELERVHIWLQSHDFDANITITGIAGSGKTALAIEYAYLYAGAYEGVLWLDATDLAASLAGLAHPLHLPEGGTQQANAKNVLQWLQTHARCLLIFDNTHADTIEPALLEQLGKHALLFLANRELTLFSTQILELAELCKDDSMLLLLRQSDIISPKTGLEDIPESTRSAATQIVALLGGLPLALNRAATYIKDMDCGLPFYLENLQKGPEALLNLLQEDSQYVQATFNTWQDTLEEVNAHAPEALELLRLCAFLHPDKLAREILWEGRAVLPSQLGTLSVLNQAIKQLRQYALVWVHETTKAISFHQLIQIMVRLALSPEQQRTYAEYAIKLMNKAFTLPEIANWNHNWFKCQRYFPQAFACEQWIRNWKIANEDSRALLHKLGRYLEERAEFKNAVQLYLLALNLDKQPEQTADILVLDLLTLAQFYDRREKYEAAENYYKQAFVCAEQAPQSFVEFLLAYKEFLQKRNQHEEVLKLQKILGHFGEQASRQRPGKKDLKKRLMINDSNAQIQYDRHWRADQRSRGNYGNDVHIASVAGASFSYEFEGYGIEIIANPSHTRWELDIFVDDEYMESVQAEQFEDPETQTIIFSETELDQGASKHTLTVNLVSGTFALDALAVFKETSEK